MSDWFTDEQVEKAALVHYAIDIGFYTATKKVKAIFAALPDDEREEYLIIARAALRAVNPYEWRGMDSAPYDNSQFLMLLSNGWRVVASGDPTQTRFAWWVISGYTHVPVEFTHKEISSDCLRAVGWMPLPPSPQEGK